mgnify:CR=1 FL=1
MKSPVVKRSIVVAGHKTSVSLEEAFWNGMKEISGLRNMTLSELVGEIDGRVRERTRAMHALLRIFEPQAVLTDDIWGYLWGKLGY